MQIANRYVSKIDCTRKYTFKTLDGFIIEACILFFENKNAPINYCISTQIGCNNTCDFCISGHLPFKRNLSPQEIYEQVGIMMLDNPQYGDLSFEVTYMGIGEPFDNIDNVIISANYIIDKYKKLTRINLSTIIPTLNIDTTRFAQFENHMRFQYSMHFTSDTQRTLVFKKQLPPIDKSLCLMDELSKTVNDSFCINYVLFEGLNDSRLDADKLIEIARKFKNSYIRVSEFVPIGQSKLHSSSRMLDFFQYLSSSGIECKTFHNMGKDISASCGHFLEGVKSAEFSI